MLHLRPTVAPFARRPQASGQVLVLFTLALIPIIAMVGLVIDGGNAFSQRRANQNGTDAAALAGAVQIAENLVFWNKGLVGPNTDADILTAVVSTATDNGVEAAVGYYTDINATVLPGTPKVGDGTIPNGAAGVQVVGSRHFGAYFTGVIGIPTWAVTTEATAVAGYVQQVGRGTVIPITIPVNVTICANNGDATPVLLDGKPTWPLNTTLILPICKGPASGNVGWLDWTPPSGGASEIEASIRNPDNPPIDLPSWVFFSQTGNTNRDGIENAINDYRGQVVLIPFFDDTCDEYPGAGTNDCQGNEGNGVKMWYHFPLFAAFRLDPVKGAFLNNKNPECEVGGNEWSGASCLKGQFVNFIGPDVTVGPNPLPGSNFNLVGVQLVK